jgi:hypothetical protein
VSRPARNLLFSPRSSRGGELGVVDPHAAQDHGKSSRNRDFGFLHSGSLGELGRPALEVMTLDRAGQDDVRGLVERRAHQPITELADPAGDILLAGLMLLRRQSKMRANPFDDLNRVGSSIADT